MPVCVFVSDASCINSVNSAVRPRQHHAIVACRVHCQEVGMKGFITYEDLMR